MSALFSTHEECRQVAGIRILGGNAHFRFSKLFRGSAQSITIGRTRHRHIRLRHGTVSKLHCVIEKTSDGLFAIRDHESKNGVYVAPFGGQYGTYSKVSVRVLHVGMYIRVGQVTMVVVDGQGQAPIWARTESEFIRNAYEVYGTHSDVNQNTNFPMRLIKKVLSRVPNKN